ncbi:hypothetical protein [Actinoplanes sp. NPDC049802]|uniref:hypothetical protein n=1 Tax=Actinoplanes sp. NPDC049802 TaxID=3154742 RepID=UPI003409C4D8
MAAALLLAATAMSACAQDRPTPPAGAGPLPDDVRAAYDGFWAAWVAARETSDPDLPALAEQIADPLLSTVRGTLAAAREQDRVTRGTVGHRIEEMTLDGDARRIVDCVDIGRWRLHAASTGEPLPGQLGGERSQLTEIVLRPVDGRWKAANMYILADRC